MVFKFGPRIGYRASTARRARNAKDRTHWLGDGTTGVEPYALCRSLPLGARRSGYIEGRNLALVLRYGDDHLERVPELAAELVQIPVDLIVAQGAANFLINKLDLPVPVVYGFSGDPVVAGFADSLARPHANMTGVTFMAPELTAKRLEPCAK